jgi:hypothetical protein
VPCTAMRGPRRDAADKQMRPCYRPRAGEAEEGHQGDGRMARHAGGEPDAPAGLTDCPLEKN